MSLISPFIPSASSDVVAIYPGLETISIPGAPPLFDIPGFIPVQVFEAARPLRVNVVDSSRFPEHPLESGALISDHKIDLPRELTMSVIIRPEDYRITYQLIKQAKILGIRFTIQTKADLYGNMYIKDIPHEEDPSNFDTITMVLGFREVQIVDSEIQVLGSLDATNPQDASTVARGAQSTSAASAGTTSTGAGFLG